MKQSEENYSNFQCFNCNKIGYNAINYPLKKVEYKKNKKRYHAHLAEGEYEEEEEEGP